MNTHNFRYDVNREVRQVLVRHSVNLSEIAYSFIGSTVYLHGSLHKDPAGDFTPVHIESLLKDLRRIEPVRNLHFDLENWSIAQDVGSWVIKKRREAAVAGAAKPENIRIDGTAKIQDVIAEMQDKGKKPSK